MLAHALSAAFLGMAAEPACIDQGCETPTVSMAQSLSSAEMFSLAEEALRNGDFALAERVLSAITHDEDVQLRSEARFRLAQLYLSQARLTESAILLREILDEQPNAQPVRLELARVLDLLGDEAGARRALREAQASGLPPDVARFVDRYSTALRAQKPIGVAIDIAMAPDSNINRATRSDTLGTIFGDFVLDEDARQRSGIGLAARGQAYGRLRLSSETNLLARISGSADIYRDSDFSDYILAISTGPELRLGADRISIELGGVLRWYGGQSYSDAITTSLVFFHPLDRVSQLRIGASAASIDNHLNPLMDGQSYATSVSYERALSSVAGIAITLAGDRQDLDDSGFSTWGGQLTIVGYRELGSFTLAGTMAHGRLEADERVALYPARRSDRYYQASLGATVRDLRVGSFSPFVRATFERNQSSVEIYNYRRLRGEVGIARAF